MHRKYVVSINFKRLNQTKHPIIFSILFVQIFNNCSTMLDNQFPPINWPKIVKIAQWTGILTLILYVGLESSAAIDADGDRVMAYRKLSVIIHDFAIFILDFARPFIEIILLFLIVDWAMKRFKVQMQIPPIGNWKIMNIVVIVVIGGFVYAALRGLNGVTYLRDLALVVLGFYFGRSVVKSE
jgi:apolipoprotein N-acyltransferase